MSENPPAAGPPATEEKQSLRYDNILLTRRGIAEIHGRKVVIFIPAADIKSIALKYGRPEHRPIISLTLGAIFAIIGILGLVDFFFAMAAFRYELGAIAFGVIGASIIYDVLKQRYFLEVQSPKGPVDWCSQNTPRKMISKPSATAPERFTSTTSPTPSHRRIDRKRCGKKSRLEEYIHYF